MKPIKNLEPNQYVVFYADTGARWAMESRKHIIISRIDKIDTTLNLITVTTFRHTIITKANFRIDMPAYQKVFATNLLYYLNNGNIYELTEKECIEHILLDTI